MQLHGNEKLDQLIDGLAQNAEGGAHEREQVLSQFQATGVQTCFHNRHINPQIDATWTAHWRLKDYEARDGYQALKKDPQGRRPEG